jgi:hypothetical protein
MFKLHETETIVEGVPTVYFDPNALAAFWTVINSVTTEIGWMSLADRLDDGNYLVQGMYIPEQRVHGATTEFTDDGMAALGTQLINEDKKNNIPKDQQRMGRLRCWVH